MVDAYGGVLQEASEIFGMPVVLYPLAAKPGWEKAVRSSSRVALEVDNSAPALGVRMNPHNHVHLYSFRRLLLGD